MRSSAHGGEHRSARAVVITSRGNPRLKALRRLQRARERAETARFAVEGEDLVREALAAGIVPDTAFLDGGRMDEDLRATLVAAGCEVVEVAGDALAAASSLAHPARCLAVVARSALPALDPGAPAARLGLRLHGVRDPGNLGTLVRAAAALGPAHLALGPGCADPLGPKAVRASMGAIFRVPLAVLDAAPSLRRVALDARAALPLDRVDCRPPVAFELGGERAGLPGRALASADAVACVPQQPEAESLNVALAGAIALYESRRQGAPA